MSVCVCVRMDGKFAYMHPKYSPSLLLLVLAHAHLNVSDPHVPLDVVADHEVSQDAAGGDLGLLDDVGAEGDPAHVLFVFDDGGDGKLGLGWSTKTGSVVSF